jgi:hypothetical protein
MQDNVIKFRGRKQFKPRPYSSAEFVAHLNEMDYHERLALADELEGIAGLKDLAALIRRGARAGYKPPAASPEA